VRLLVNCERLLTHVAAGAARSGASLAPSVPDPPVARPSAGSAAWAGMGSHTPIDEARAEELETLIRTLVVGEAAELCVVLAVDAVGWSPSGSFTRRDEAVALIQQPVSSLAVDAFRVETLCWCEPLVFAGWSLQARQVNALLFNEDVLLEATGRTVELGGTTIARVEADRVARTFTHFDDADLIEQVILGR
jgi:hypothetical protein